MLVVSQQAPDLTTSGANSVLARFFTSTEAANNCSLTTLNKP